MSATPSWLDGPGLVGRFAGIGVGLGGVMGAIAGLVIGLLVYTPTAWFAIAELGLPAAVAGGGVGLLVGLATRAARRRAPH